MKAKLLWRWIKLFNCNAYFREHIRTLKYVGDFYIRHSSHHLLWFEAVTYVSYHDKTQEYSVKKKINKKFVWVGKDKLHLNAR